MLTSLWLVILLSFSMTLASNTENVAVLPFQGDSSVSTQQLNFLAGKYEMELMETNAFRILDRSRTELILKEQGFQQSGACNSSECQVQMGQLLGVDKVISGNLVRFGKKYAFHSELIDVSTGQVVVSVELSQAGDLEDVYEELCRGAALKLVEKVNGGHSSKIPADAIPKPIQSSLSLKRKIALALGATAIGSSGAGFYFNQIGLSSKDDLELAVNNHDRPAARTAYADLQNRELGRNVGYGVAAGTAIIGLVLWFLPE